MKKMHTISFRHAWDGIAYALTTQPNFRIHLVLSATALILGLVFNIHRIEWAILIIVIALGLVIEMLNTAVEAVVDLATDQWHVHAKHAKDVAAGAMLVYAVAATLVAMCIFLPYFFS